MTRRRNIYDFSPRMSGVPHLHLLASSVAYRPVATQPFQSSMVLSKTAHDANIKDHAKDSGDNEFRDGINSVACVEGAYASWANQSRSAKVPPQKSADVPGRSRTELSAASSAKSPSCFGRSPTQRLRPSPRSIRVQDVASCAGRVMSPPASCLPHFRKCFGRLIERIT
jgi:hypothetical protein